MKIKIIDPNDNELLTLTFNLLDVNISRGRLILVRSIASQNGFLSGLTTRKDESGLDCLVIQRRNETDEKKIKLLVRDLVKELL